MTAEVEVDSPEPQRQAGPDFGALGFLDLTGSLCLLGLYIHIHYTHVDAYIRQYTDYTSVYEYIYIYIYICVCFVCIFHIYICICTWDMPNIRATSGTPLIRGML